MKMPEFIRQQAESILLDWDQYADTLRPAASNLSRDELRDGAAEILHAIAAEMEASQSKAERQAKGKSDPEPPSDVKVIAKEHAEDRLMQRFTLDQMAAEYRVLRAGVTRRWTEHLVTYGSEESEELKRGAHRRCHRMGSGGRQATHATRGLRPAYRQAARRG